MFFSYSCLDTVHYGAKLSQATVTAECCWFESYLKQIGEGGECKETGSCIGRVLQRAGEDQEVRFH